MTKDRRSGCGEEDEMKTGGGGGGSGGSGQPMGLPTLLESNSTNGLKRTNSRPKCRCWCCCCSCSCLALKNGGSGDEPRKSRTDEDDATDPSQPQASLEEIRSWGESFEVLMRSPGGRRVFRDFLRCEYSEENILFWLACEDLKGEKSPALVEEKARLIYEDYISILSPKEVSLDSRVRELVNENMKNPLPTTFDEAQVQIYTLMHRDSYPRFVNSPLYRKLAQVSSSSPPATSSSSPKFSPKESLPPESPLKSSS